MDDCDMGNSVMPIDYKTFFETWHVWKDFIENMELQHLYPEQCGVFAFRQSPEPGREDEDFEIFLIGSSGTARGFYWRARNFAQKDRRLQYRTFREIVNSCGGPSKVQCALKACDGQEQIMKALLKDYNSRHFQKPPLMNRGEKKEFRASDILGRAQHV